MSTHLIIYLLSLWKLCILYFTFLDGFVVATFSLGIHIEMHSINFPPSTTMSWASEEDSSSNSASSGNETLESSGNVWQHIMASTGETLTANTQLFVDHDGVAVITIHPENRTGIVCSKYFKLNTQRSFLSLSEDCASGPHAATEVDRHAQYVGRYPIHSWFQL